MSQTPASTPAFRALVGGLAAAGAISAAAPRAQAQGPDEIVVYAERAPYAKPAATSYAVGYADLDLRTKAARDELRRRVRVTAGYLCVQLADNDIPGCKDITVRDTRRLVVEAENRAIGQTSWTPGPTWTPPPG